jgi:hypothetical protein
LALTGRPRCEFRGTIMDCWQMALEDVGPAGVDKGKGGKYLILPPGYKDKTPGGYIALPSGTYQGFALLRSILKSRDAADVAKAAPTVPTRRFSIIHWFCQTSRR